MRLSGIFFLFVCFILLGRSGSAYAGRYPGKACHSPAQNRVLLPGIKKEAGKPDLCLSSHHDTPGETDSTIFADDDDQEESSKKSKSPGEGFSTSFFACIAAPPARDPSNTIFFRSNQCRINSCKYILQRVLRI